MYLIDDEFRSAVTYMHPAFRCEVVSDFCDLTSLISEVK